MDKDYSKQPESRDEWVDWLRNASKGMWIKRADEILLAISAADQAGFRRGVDESAKIANDHAMGGGLNKGRQHFHSPPGSTTQSEIINFSPCAVRIENAIRSLTATQSTGECRHESYSVNGHSHVSCNFCAMELPRDWTAKPVDQPNRKQDGKGEE